jgi:2-methylcitrate dehydratase PrpD
MSSASIAEIIGAHAAAFRYEDIPASVREHAKYLMLDAIGIAFASSQFEFSQRAYCALQAQESGADGSVIGYPGKLPMRDAVMLNSMLVHGLDFDDTYFAGGVHPTAACLPAALGVAANADASGSDLLTAYILGMEVETRLAGVAQGNLNQCGFHPSSVLGAFGGAIVAGWLMRLNARQFAMAQGIALGMAGGTLESLRDGSWTKRMQPGWAAAGGITAARLARGGFVGARLTYEGDFGVFPAFMAAWSGPSGRGATTTPADGRTADAAQREFPGCDFGAATRQLGTHWNIEDVALKAFPACHAAQAAIQAVLEIQLEHALPVDDIEAIVAIVPPNYVKLVCEPAELKRRPDSIYGAQFSIPFTVASAFVHGRFGLAQIAASALADERVLALAQKVGYEVDPQFRPEQYKTSRPAELVVRMRDGRVLRRKVEKLLGTPDRPMTRDEILAKFMDNAQTVMSAARARQVCERLLEIERHDKARDFIDLLSG